MAKKAFVILSTINFDQIPGHPAAVLFAVAVLDDANANVPSVRNQVPLDYGSTLSSVRAAVTSTLREDLADPALPVVFLDDKGLL